MYSANSFRNILLEIQQRYLIESMGLLLYLSSLLNRDLDIKYRDEYKVVLELSKDEINHIKKIDLLDVDVKKNNIVTVKIK